VARGRPTGALGEGLPALRRSGSVTELLFLYECLVLAPVRLRPVAERLGLTVQAVSHSYRALRRRGLVTRREGHYEPTVAGIAWLHESLVHLGDDVRARVDRLHVVRSCRAVAGERLSAGATVSLALEDGILTARPNARGPSRGRAAVAARPGELVGVTDLEGIVPITPAAVRVRTLDDSDLVDKTLGARLARVVAAEPGLLGAEGLEAYHALHRATSRPLVRFAVATSALEAARIGVPSTVVVHERDLPRLLSAFAVANPPPLEVAALGAASRGPRPRARSGRARA
jgi:predicted transcriptional regulator